MTDENKIGELYQKLINYWNERNAKGMASLFTEQGKVIGFDGSVMDSPESINEQLSQIFRDHPTPAYVTHVREIRFLADNVGVLYAVSSLKLAEKNDINPNTNAHQTLISVKLKDDQWHIELFQNTPAAFHGQPQLAQALTDELRQLLF